MIGNFFAEYCSRLKSLMTEGLGQRTVEEMDDEEVDMAVLSIGQKPTQFIPIIVDLNLHFAHHPGEPYDTSFIQKVVKCIQSAIFDYYEIDRDDQDVLTCIVSEWTTPAVVKDRRPGHESAHMYRLRFQFPFCRVGGDTISKLVPRISAYLRRVNAIGALEQTPIGDWEQILKPLINDPIPLYGSSEKKEYPMLIVSEIYDDLIDEDLDASLIETLAVEDVFSINEHSLAKTGVINPDIFEGLDDTDLLPVYLSNNFTAKTVSVRMTESTPSFDIEEDIPQEFGRFTEQNRNEKTRIEIAIDLLSLVSLGRFLRRLSWIDIGKALHNSCNGESEGLCIWIQYTERAINNLKGEPDYLNGRSVHDVCREEYESFDTDGVITVKTIAWFAQEDNPVNYKKWHNRWAMPYRESALTAVDNDIAKALYCDIWLKFCCGSISHRDYYEFRNHRWIKIDGGYSIRNYISTEFKRTFEDLRANLAVQVAHSNDNNYKARTEETLKALSSLIGKLGTTGKKSNIMKEITDLIFVERFDDVVNKNGNITGHPNGVTEVDYDNRLIEFRAGKPEDYITRTTLARFCPDMTWEHPRVVELMDYLEKFQTVEETRHFFLKLLGSGFKAGNLDKKLPVLTGDKNNSKSTVVKLIMKTWGSYAVKFPTTGLTRGYSDSGSANPAWARLAGPRFAFADEPDQKERFHSGPTKLVSGNDDFYARQLYKEGGDLEPTATVITACNKPPPFENADDACKERFFLLPCASTWLPADRIPRKEDGTFQDRYFAMDKDFINRVKFFGPALLWVSFQYFPIWAEEGLEDIPEEIQQATDAYWAENDVYLMYTSDRIETTDDGNVSLTVTELYQDFEVWYNKFNKGKDCPDRGTFRYHLISRWGERPTNNAWWGIKFKEVNTHTATNSMASGFGKSATKENEKTQSKPAKAPEAPKQSGMLIGLASLEEVPRAPTQSKKDRMEQKKELMGSRHKPDQTQLGTLLSV